VYKDGGKCLPAGTQTKTSPRFYLAENGTYVGSDETLRLGPLSDECLCIAGQRSRGIMSGFYVDVAGLNGLYNQLVRASRDASDTLSYTKQHCDMPAVSEGFLMILMGPHAETYKKLTAALTKLSELAQNAGTQISAAQGGYARADQASAARLDATYPGATNPGYVQGMLATSRPDLQPQRSAFTDVAEPATHLTSPEYAVGIEMWSINPLADPISPAAWLRQVSIWLFGRDPFEGWASDISGDWRAYTHCAVAMGHIGEAAKDIGTNVLAGAGDVGTVWRGKAAEAEQEFQLALGLAGAGLDDSCARYQQLYLQAADAVKSFVRCGVRNDCRPARPAYHHQRGVRGRYRWG
jgi:hypothetical protein